MTETELHSRLKHYGMLYLWMNRYRLVAKEVGTVGDHEYFDVVGLRYLRKGPVLSLVEAKATRSDAKSRSQKRRERATTAVLAGEPQSRWGVWRARFNYHYLIVPPDLEDIKPPCGWGLLVAGGKPPEIRVKSRPTWFEVEPGWVGHIEGLIHYCNMREVLKVAAMNLWRTDQYYPPADKYRLPSICQPSFDGAPVEELAKHGVR